MLNAELRHRYVSGIAVDPQTADVRIVSVEPNSPAAASDVRVGDVIVSIDGRVLRDPVDWEFMRFDLRPEQEITLGLKREGQELSATLKLAPREHHPAVEVAKTEPGLQCRVAAFDPRVSDPLSDDNHPAGPPMIIPEVTATPPRLPREEHYELLIEGLLEIKEAGLYRLALKSDDGSKLFLHNRLVLDNGGNHAPQIRTGWVDLAVGLHPLRIEFYEDEGNQLLELSIAKDSSALRPVRADELWHEMPPE